MDYLEKLVERVKSENQDLPFDIGINKNRCVKITLKPHKFIDSEFHPLNVSEEWVKYLEGIASDLGFSLNFNNTRNSFFKKE